LRTHSGDDARVQRVLAEYISLYGGIALSGLEFLVAAKRIDYLLRFFYVLRNCCLGLCDYACDEVIPSDRFVEVLLERGHFRDAFFYCGVARIGPVTGPNNPAEDLSLLTAPVIEYAGHLVPDDTQRCSTAIEDVFVQIGPPMGLRHFLDVLAARLTHTHY
jgi:hypothetical protein